MKPGQMVPTNKNLITAGPLVEHLGGRVVDVVVDAASQPARAVRYKGNVDLEKLEALLKRDREQVAFLLLTASVPMVGGQMLSLENLQAGRGAGPRRRRHAWCSTPPSSPRRPTCGRSGSSRTSRSTAWCAATARPPTSST